MTRLDLAGKKCRVRKLLSTAIGRIDRATEGRVRYGFETVGRLLLLVDWQGGGSSIVFPDELDIVDEFDAVSDAA